MLDYACLSAVSAVIREGSFEGAARKLRITPSAVSQRVRGYEERLGALLIVRGQPCRATALGETLAAHVDKVRLLEAEIPHLSGATDEADHPVVTIRVAVNADSLAAWLPDVATHCAENLNICLDLLVEDEALTADRLRSGEVTAAVTAQTDPVPGCKSVPIGRLRYLACASPAFVTRYLNEGLTDTSIAAAPCLCFDNRDSVQRRWREIRGFDTELRRTHYVPSTQALIDFAVRGLGWALQPSALVQRFLEKGELVVIDPDYPVDVELYWVTPRLKSALLTDLTKHMVRACAQHSALI
ncbi:LysR family transcriptional regulator ArgP [Asaia sp. BMEF1]|uniref:LysR family transcriptional regulator ArgP n=1 Tax=Asaia sp. BMEF1 TaxID=3155932 RepID=UPI003F6735D7